MTNPINELVLSAEFAFVQIFCREHINDYTIRNDDGEVIGYEPIGSHLNAMLTGCDNLAGLIAEYPDAPETEEEGA